MTDAIVNVATVTAAAHRWHPVVTDGTTPDSLWGVITADKPAIWYKFEDSSSPITNYGYGAAENSVTSATASGPGWLYHQSSIAGDPGVLYSMLQDTDSQAEYNVDTYIEMETGQRTDRSSLRWQQPNEDVFSVEIIVKPMHLLPPEDQLYDGWYYCLWSWADSWGPVLYYRYGQLMLYADYTLYGPADAPLVNNNTYHIVCTSTKDRARMYINGTCVGDTNGLDPWGDPYSWDGVGATSYSPTRPGSYGALYFNGRVVVGDYDYDNWNAIGGKYQHFAFYDYELSPEQVQAHYDAAEFNAVTHMNEPISPDNVAAVTSIGSPDLIVHPVTVAASATIGPHKAQDFSLLFYIGRDVPLLWWKLDDAVASYTGSQYNRYYVRGRGSLVTYPAYGYTNTPDANVVYPNNLLFHQPSLLGVTDQDYALGTRQVSEYDRLEFPGYYTGPSAYQYGLNLNTSSFTVEYLVKHINFPGNYYFWKVGGGNIFTQHNSDGKISVGYDGSVKATTSASLTADVKAHIALTYDASDGKAIIYVNGVQSASVTYPTGGLGTRWNSTITFPNGYSSTDVQDFAIYPLALSATQVAEHANSSWVNESAASVVSSASMSWILSLQESTAASAVSSGLMVYTHTDLPNAIATATNTATAQALRTDGRAAFYMQENVGVAADTSTSIGAAFYLDENVTNDVPTPQIWKVVSPTAQPGDPFTIYLFGVGASSATYSATLYTTVGASAVEIVPTSWQFVDASSAVDLPTRTINPVTGQIDTQYVVITANIPQGLTSVSSPGFPVYVQIDTGGGGSSVSGSAFASVLDAPADPSIGWWIEIYDHRFPTIWLERFTTYSALAFADAVNDVGMGSVTFATDDPITQAMDAGSGVTAPGGAPAGTWTSTSPDDKYNGTGTYRKLLDGSHYWRIMQGGVERFRFIHEGTKKERVKPEGPEMIVVSGRGRAVELEWGIVLPEPLTPVIPGVPYQNITYVHYNKQRVFKNTSWAVAFQTLLDEAQQRGEMSNELHVSFTYASDSRLVVWTDQADYVADIGTNLLEQLNTWAAQVGFEWHVLPDGLIEAAISLGEQRQGTAVFVEGVNIESSDDTRNTESLRSSVYVEGSNNRFTGLSDTAAWIQWGNRATYIKSQDVVDARGRAMVAVSTLATMKEPDWTRGFKAPVEIQDPVSGAVLTAAQGFPRAFSDYRVADWVGYQGLDSTNDMYKVMEMGIGVDSNGQASLELGLQTRRQQWIELQKRLLKKQLSGNYTSAKQPFNSNPALDGLHDVNLTVYDDPKVEPVGPLHGATMRISYDQTGTRVMPGQNQWVPSPGEPTFFYSGLIDPIGPTSRWYAPSPGRASRVHASVGTSDSVPIVIGLWISGIHVHNVTIPANQYNIYETINFPIKSGDYLQVSVESCGTNHAYMTVQWTA